MDEETPEAPLQEQKTQSTVELDVKIDMSCWLLEVFAKEIAREIDETLYCKKTIDIIQQCISLFNPAKRVRLLHLVSSMMEDPSRLGNPENLLDLICTLRSRIADQYDQEKSSTKKSLYLQALVQCLLSIRSGLKQLQDSHTTPQSELDMDRGIWAMNDITQSLVHLSPEGSITLCIGRDEKLTIHTKSPFVMSQGTCCWDCIIRKNNDYGIFVGVLQKDQALIMHEGEIGTEECPGIGLSAQGIQGYLEVGEGRSLHLDIDVKSLTGVTTMFSEGDIISFVYDHQTCQLDVERNGVPLVVLLGPPGSKALVKIDPNEYGHMILYPAATLASVGDEVSVKVRNHFHRGSKLLTRLNVSRVIVFAFMDTSL